MLKFKLALDIYKFKKEKSDNSICIFYSSASNTSVYPLPCFPAVICRLSITEDFHLQF
jgi:hypothetical protein